MNGGFVFPSRPLSRIEWYGIQGLIMLKDMKFIREVKLLEAVIKSKRSESVKKAMIQEILDSIDKEDMDELHARQARKSNNGSNIK